MSYKIVTSFVLLMAVFGNKTVFADEQLRARNDAIIVRAIERMDGYDFKNDQHVTDAITRHMERVAGTQEYLDLAKKFRPSGMEKQLQHLILNGPSDNSKSQAAMLLLEAASGKSSLSELIHSKDVNASSSVARILGIVGNDSAHYLLIDAAENIDLSFEVRKQSILGLAKNGKGQNLILKSASENRLPADMRLLAGGLLTRSNNEAIKERAGRILPQPQTKDTAPSAPIDQLAAMKGTIDQGRKLFEGVGTCSNCHIVNRNGKEVGPDLSEIGSKLSREAMYIAILDPSAGISHNYENHSVLTNDGQVVNGLKISDTDQEIVIRTVDAIDKRIAKDEVELIKKSDKSKIQDEVTIPGLDQITSPVW